jgi:hypothetical protein
VRKRGRTTGLTYGTVDSISLSVNLDYEDGIGFRTLTNQIGITPDTTHNAMFGDHGDSGSVVVNNAREVVGLYFAGSSDGYGVANPIAEVLAALNISMCIPQTKSILKDFIDNKRIRKEKIEKLEIKERKLEKLEIKERKLEKLEIKEKFELKERKPEKFEVEGRRPPFEPPPIDNVKSSTNLEDRVTQLEAVIGQLDTFITPEMRPDLNMGALAQEKDLTETDLTALSQQLQKDANDAIQSKANFDTQLPRQ